MGAENTPKTPPQIAPDHAGSAPIEPVGKSWQQSLPGMSMKPPGSDEPGEVEAGVREQIAHLREQQLLTAAHAGQVALAIRTARDVDESRGIGAPSGRAKLMEVLNDILGELPQLEQRDPGMLDSVVQAILGTTPVPTS